MSGWRTIESAPKDGTWILLFDPSFKDDLPVAMGNYMTIERRDERGRFRAGEWYLMEWDGLPSCCEPTHWQPLPPPQDTEEITTKPNKTLHSSAKVASEEITP